MDTFIFRFLEGSVTSRSAQRRFTRFFKRNLTKIHFFWELSAAVRCCVMTEIRHKATTVDFVVLFITIPGAQGALYRTVASSWDKRREKDFPRGVPRCATKARHSNVFKRSNVGIFGEGKKWSTLRSVTYLGTKVLIVCSAN